MGVYRFEDLRVWQAAKRQCDRVGELIRRPEFLGDPELSSQMNAANISVMFNISEGFLTRRDREFLQHLRYSAASNGELRSGFYAAHGRKYIDKVETDDLVEESNGIGKMLRRLQESLDR